MTIEMRLTPGKSAWCSFCGKEAVAELKVPSKKDPTFILTIDGCAHCAMTVGSILRVLDIAPF